MPLSAAPYALGLLLFACSAVAATRPVVWRCSTAVLANGALCHGAHVGDARVRARTLVWWWDVACNAVLCAYVNAVSATQPRTLALTLYAAVCFSANRRLRSWWVHVTGVQFPLWVALCTH